MIRQPARLTRALLEQRRLAAAPLLRVGQLTQAEIAQQMGGSRARVTQWKKPLAQAGLAGLRQWRASGRASRLTEAQWSRLLHRLQPGARAAGFETERWALRRMARVIERTVGVLYHFRSLGRALHAQGWRPPTPAAAGPGAGRGV